MFLNLCMMGNDLTIARTERTWRSHTELFRRENDE
jgi:hypothetical protein